MKPQVKPTTKNSPKITTGDSKGKFNGSAEEYAAPHTMDGKRYSVASFQAKMDAVPYATDKSAQDADLKDPLPNGVSYGVAREKTSGIEMRGAGAATKGRMSRGPMA